MGETAFPNESEDYRAARRALLESEMKLRALTEEVAAQRRALPLGGAVPEDYAFTRRAGGDVEKTKLSELFAAHDTLFLYGFMYGPKMERPCPLCTSMIDGLNAQAKHIQQRVDVAVVARSPIGRILRFAGERGWKDLRFVSSEGTKFPEHYLTERGDSQMPMAHVFVKRDGVVHHQWSSELLYADSIDGGDSRHVDALWPLWNVLDLTPDGRGDFYPALSYD
ncbi:MAG: DUF899 family protein [Sandaracinaceae bacterium]